jgi:hypothetical protein
LMSLERAVAPLRILPVCPNLGAYGASVMEITTEPPDALVSSTTRPAVPPAVALPEPNST